MQVDVVYDERNGNVVALATAAEANTTDMALGSGPSPGPGQRTARLELPTNVTLQDLDTARLHVDTTDQRVTLTLR